MFVVSVTHPPHRTALGFVLSAGLLAAALPQTVLAQPPIIAIGPPSFQTRTGPSLENEVLDRLALGQPAPGDLERLSRLTLLQSIALAATLQADLARSPLAVRLEGEIADLLTFAEAFDASVNLPPAELARRSSIAQQLSGAQVAQAFDESANVPQTDFSSLARSLELLSGVQRAFSTLESDQAILSGASPRVGAHLRGLSRLIPAMSSEMEAVQASAGFRPDFAPAANPNAIRSLAQATLVDLARLIRHLNESFQGRPGGAALADELNNLFDLIQGFDRIMGAQAPEPSQKAMFLPVVRRLHQVEAEAIAVDRSIRDIREFRQARERIQAIAETFQIPRVISPAAPGRLPAREYRGLTSQFDRAANELDSYLEQISSFPDADAPAARLGSAVFRLRLELLEFRQRMISSGLSPSLAPRLRAMQTLYREIAGRAGSDARIIRAAESPGRLRLEPVATALDALAGSLSSRS
jgi:hypothetical protein